MGERERKKERAKKTVKKRFLKSQRERVYGVFSNKS